MSRPPVSVVVPFGGGDGASLAESLRRLDLGPEDEVLVADNTPGAILGRVDGARVVVANAERSSYFARNAAAREARNPWLLFLDADCSPGPRLLAAYFAEPLAVSCGAMAGAIVGDPGQHSFLARYLRSRRFFDQAGGLHEPEGGSALTGNLVVRRAAFEAVGGFTTGIRSGGDFDLSRRLVATGWTIESRPAAVVHHHHREGWLGFLGTMARYGAGARWLEERYPESGSPWPLVPGVIGSTRDVVRNVLRLRFEEAAFRATDGVGLLAHHVGYRLRNTPPGAGVSPPAPPPP